MALGFQDCCNSSSYFLLTGIPASVQEFETYYIQTLQGETFCAKYVELPKLNYSLPIYTLVTMTQQSDVNCPTYTVKVTSGVGCNLTYTNCAGSNQTISAVLNSNYLITAQENTISVSPGCSLTILSQTPGLTACQKCTAESPCPAEQSIFLSQFGTGTIATSTDCYIKTIFPMVVNCNIDPPTSELTSDGTLGLYIIGGVAPYIAYEAGTHLTDNPTVYDVVPSSSPNTYTVRENLPEGTYSLTVTDSQGNFFVDVSCTLDAPPAPATVNCSGVPPSTSFEDDGSITINVAGGIPPYTLLNSNGVSIQTLANDGSITINNLTSGNYTYTLVETAQGSFDANETTINCNVPAGVNVTYPSTLCLSMLLCSQTGNENTFYLTLIQQGTYNNRPEYVLNSYSVSIIGNPSGFKIRWGGDNVGWTSVAGTASGQPSFATPSSCSSSSNSFSLTSSYTAAGTIPLTALPQNFTWTRGSGYLTDLNAASISLSSNACPVNVFVGSASDTTICQNNVNSDATIILTANGGSGGAYSFFYRKGTTGSYTGPVTSPITIASSANAAGNYQVYSVDNSGAQSSTQTFTITNLCLSLTVTPSSPVICPNWEDQQGVVTFTLTSSNSNSTGPYIFYWRKQSSPALQWNVISNNNPTQTVTVYGLANPGNAASLAGNNGFGIYEFYVESTNGDNSGVVTSTLNNISCGPAPLQFSNPTIVNPTCNNAAGSATITVTGGVPPYDYYLYSYDGTLLSSSMNNNNTNFTFNNITVQQFSIEVIDSANASYNGGPFTIEASPEIRVLIFSELDTNNLSQTTTSQGRKTWNYPIDINFRVEYPNGVGDLDGILEIKLLTQRIFSPYEGSSAKNYADGYYLGMNNWNDITVDVGEGVASIRGPINTWIEYMYLDGVHYPQPNVFPNNNIDPNGAQLSNFITQFTEEFGYYTDYATSYYKHCNVETPPQIVGQTAPSTNPSATVSTAFYNYSRPNCQPPEINQNISCLEFSKFFPNDEYYSQGFVAYYPNSSNDDFDTFMTDTQYVVNQNLDNNCFDNPSPTITWTNLAKRTYVTSLNGTLIVDRTFEFGSASSPLQIGTSSEGTIRVNFSDYNNVPNNSNMCDGYGLAFQIQVKLHTVGTIPHCPGDSNTPLTVKYYYNTSSLNQNGAVGPNTEYTAGLKMMGNDSYPSQTFTYSRLIYNIGTGESGCNQSSGGGFTG